MTEALPGAGDTGVRVVLVTCPDAGSARDIAAALVNESRVACVNILPGIESVYRWQGAVERASEVLLVLKTTAGALADLQARVAELHPYEVPECIALPVVAGLPAYLDWVQDNVEQPI